MNRITKLFRICQHIMSVINYISVFMELHHQLCCGRADLFGRFSAELICTSFAIVKISIVPPYRYDASVMQFLLTIL
jgi:hypothetical protein